MDFKFIFNMDIQNEGNNITKATNVFINSLFKKGWWQILMYTLLEQSIMYCGVFIAFSGTFTGGHMDYQCNIPKNNTFLEPIINKCDVWNKITNTTEKCIFGYNFSSEEDFIRTSIKADFELVCERKFYDGATQSFVMAGFFVGGIFGPLVADKFGRRMITFISLMFAGVIGIVIALINNVYLFMFGNLLLGILREVAMSAGFVYGLEFIPNDRQSLYGMITQLLWTFNIILLGIMAYFIREWRYLQILGSIPILLSGFLVLIVPESPRWLITKGKFEILQNVVKKYANKVNNIKSSSSEINVLKDVYIRNAAQYFSKSNSTQYSPADIFRSKILFFWTAILILNWMFIILSYYGSTMLSVNFPGNKYLSFTLNVCMEVPCILLTFFCIKAGRNIIFLSLNLLCALCYIIVGFVSKEYSIVILILSVIGKGSLGAIFYVIVVTSIYIFPTTIRSFGTGLPSALGKLFSIVVPYFVKLYYIYNWLPTLIIGVSACFIGILNIMYPDWINQPFPETLNDVNLLRTKVGFRSCKGRKVKILEVEMKQ